MRDVYAGTPGSERYAGFWIRVGANVLDLLILGALSQMLLLGSAGRPPDSAAAIGSVSASPLGPEVIFGLALPACFFVGSWMVLGASPGKLICRLRIVDEPSGGRLTVWQCIGRYAMGLVVLALLGVGYFYVAIDPRKQGWHDKVVRTLVVHRGRTT